MSLLMYAICYTHLIFIMLLHFFVPSKFEYRNKDAFFKLLLLLSGDISLNLEPSYMNQTSGNNE